MNWIFIVILVALYRRELAGLIQDVGQLAATTYLKISASFREARRELRARYG